MNSRQRRRDRRLWKYSIKISYTDFAHYSAMWEWLKSQYGTNVHRCGWRDRHEWYPANEYDVEWQFIDQRRAVEFALKWGA